MTTSTATEARVALIAGAVGAAFVAAISGKDQYFFGNFMYMWVPHAAPLLLLLALRTRPATIAGASLAATVHLAAFWLWVTSLPMAGNGLAWLAYFFALPGGMCAALLARALIDTKRPLLHATLLSFGMTLLGFALNQGLLCMTLVYCGW